MKTYTANIVPFVHWHYDVEEPPPLEAAGPIPVEFKIKIEHRPEGIRFRFVIVSKRVKVKLLVNNEPRTVMVDPSKCGLTPRGGQSLKTVINITLCLNENCRVMPQKSSIYVAE